MSIHSRNLPVKYPLITTWPYHANMLSILSAYECCVPWILTNYIQILDRGWPIVWLDYCILDYNLIGNNPWLKEKTLKFNKTITNELITSQKTTITEFLINFIDKDYYVFIDALNDFYIPGTTQYQKNLDSIHSFLIYGYNRNEKKFNIGGHFESGKYQLTEITFENFDNAYFGSNKEYTDHIQFIKLGKPWDREDYKLDLKLIKQLLEDYLYSRNTFERMAMYMNPVNKCVWGISVYEKIIEYLTNGIEGDKKRIDHRQFHLLWEHKRILCELCIQLEQNNMINNGKHYIEEFREIQKESLIILNMTLKFLFTHKHEIIKKIVILLQKNRQREINVIEKIINDLYI